MWTDSEDFLWESFPKTKLTSLLSFQSSQDYASDLDLPESNSVSFFLTKKPQFGLLYPRPRRLILGKREGKLALSLYKYTES